MSGVMEREEVAEEVRKGGDPEPRWGVLVEP